MTGKATAAAHLSISLNTLKVVNIEEGRREAALPVVVDVVVAVNTANTANTQVHRTTRFDTNRR